MLMSEGAALETGGIRLYGETSRKLQVEREKVLQRIAELGLTPYVEMTSVPVPDHFSTGFRLRQDPDAAFSLSHDTTALCEAFGLNTMADPRDLEREIWLAMLVSPVFIDYPSFAELESAIRIRMNIVHAARKTFVRFDTMQVDRPTDYWTWDDDCGFLLQPGKSLTRALQVATQPGDSDRIYAFSCKRASEYVMLLGLVQEAETAHPDLYRRLVKQSQTRALRGDDFDHAYLQKVNKNKEPLKRFFIPGDRVWFRNPDKFSSDITGFEGCFTIYLGNGRFPNFWKKGRTETLISKCLIHYYWRDAVYQNAEGDWQVDEPLADRLAEAALKDPEQVDQIVDELMQWVPSWAGGCTEPSRECARFIHPGTESLALPDVPKPVRQTIDASPVAAVVNH